MNERQQDIPVPAYQSPSPAAAKIDPAQVERDNRKKFIEEQRAQMKKDIAKKAQQRKNDFGVEINGNKN